MFTGWSPGRHGMYDFRVLETSRYTQLWGAGHSAGFGDEPRFVTSKRWRGSAFWDLLGPEPTVAVSAVPMTYPAWPVNGTMISGFPLPDYTRNHAYPPGAADGLPNLLEGGDEMAGMTDEDVAAHCAGLVERQSQVVRGWLEPDGPDVMVAVFQGTDFAQHRLWKYLDQPGHPLNEALLGLYRAIDTVIGEARERLGEEAIIAVVSDHGFGPHPHTVLHTDAALRDAGMLATSGPTRTSGLRRLARRPPPSPQTAAVGRSIAIARRRYAGRALLRSRSHRLEPDSGVPLSALRTCGGSRRQSPWSAGCRVQSEPGDQYERVRDQVIEMLTALSLPDGRPAVRWAKRREDVFSGDHVDRNTERDRTAPTPRSQGVVGYLNGVFAAVSSIRSSGSFSGVHADGRDSFAIAGPGRPGRRRSLGERDITDVRPDTYLRLLGVTPTGEIDGCVMKEEALQPAEAPAPGSAVAHVPRDGRPGHDRRRGSRPRAIAAVAGVHRMSIDGGRLPQACLRPPFSVECRSPPRPEQAT